MTAPPDTQRRTRLLLLAGIAVALVASVVMHLKLAERRERAEQGEVGGPAAQVKRALEDADRAVINRDPQAAWSALVEARDGLDTLLEDRPAAPDLLRARMLVARRLGHVAEQRGQGEAALSNLQEAYERAAALHDADPANDQTQMDRLQTARALVEYLRAVPNHAAAAKVARDAAEGVEGPLAGLNPSSTLRAALAEVWLDAARAHGEQQEAAPMLRALERAVGQARAATVRAEDPVSAQARVYLALMTAAELTAARDDEGSAEAFERDAIATLEVRERLQPQDLELPRTRAALKVRVADRAQKLGRPDRARDDLEQALALRRTLVEEHPDNAALRADLVRSLNHLAAFHSAAGRDREALEAYAEAAERAKGLADDEARLRVLSLGNHAQLLGRLDKTREARDEAAEAYALAETLRAKGGAVAALDAAVAGLRYARLLRAPPGADRKKAKAVAEAERAKVEAFTGKKGERYTQTVEGLDALLKELR